MLLFQIVHTLPIEGKLQKWKLPNSA